MTRAQHACCHQATRLLHGLISHGGDEDIMFPKDEEGSGGLMTQWHMVRDDEETARYPTRGEDSRDIDTVARGRR
jgi:hypothetical protein